MYTKQFELPTHSHSAMINISRQVKEIVKESGIVDGLVTVFCPHTTGAITINENADPDVVDDMLTQLDKMVPWRQSFYAHSEGNSAAHVKSSMFGASETIPLHDGKLVVGVWQGIYFCEFDGPRTRKCIVSILGQ